MSETPRDYAITAAQNVIQHGNWMDYEVRAMASYIIHHETALAAANAKLAATRCPIGLDGHHEICSAGTCHKCFAEHLAAATAEAERNKRDAEIARSLLPTIRARWDQSASRYAKAGSDWHERMPSDWPVKVTFTVGQIRAALSERADKQEKST